jgi:hypothetical protein
MTCTGISFALTPWLAPAYSGLVGTTSGEPAVAVTFEWPLTWLKTVEPLGQFESEWLYLRRYSADQALATGQHAFAAVQKGGDPPDALVRTDAGELGVESTSLTLTDRRGAHALFQRVRQQVQSAEPTSFARLAGNVVYIWFGENEAEVGRPPRAADDAEVEALVAALATYEPQPDQMALVGPLPETAPVLPLAKAGAASRFYSVPLQQAAPGSVLFAIAGFDIGLAYTTLLTANQVWAELQRIIDKHDKPGVELLLVTAGAPNQHGMVYPSEEAIADFLVNNPAALATQPTHIAQVVLHSWATGRATLIYPETRPLFGPLYQSMVPVNHPLAALALRST